jgi:tetratricopeptide (TPR) repeat protein
MDNLSVADIQIIEQRLENQLSKPEIQSFDNRLRSDADFKKGYLSYQNALKAIHLAGEDDVIAIFKEEQAKLDIKSNQVEPVALTPVRNPKILSKTKSRTLAGLRGWLAAASIALVCVAGYWFLNAKKSIDSEALFTQFYQPKTNTFIKFTRGDNEYFEAQKQLTISKYGVEDGTKIFDALSFYEKGNFEKATTLFSSINLKNDALYLYHANALLNSNQTLSAISILEKISSTSPMIHEAYWYKAMAYLKIKEVEKAKALLVILSKGDNKGFQDKAKDLLKRF